MPITLPTFLGSSRYYRAIYEYDFQFLLFFSLFYCYQFIRLSVGRGVLEWLRDLVWRLSCPPSSDRDYYAQEHSNLSLPLPLPLSSFRQRKQKPSRQSGTEAYKGIYCFYNLQTKNGQKIISLSNFIYDGAFNISTAFSPLKAVFEREHVVTHSSSCDDKSNDDKHM